MISKLAIFHRSGAVLWTSPEKNIASKTESNETLNYSDEKNDEKHNVKYNEPINRLIQNVLLSDRSALDIYQSSPYTLKWIFANNFNLVFVAVYFSFQKLLYIQQFLETIKSEFLVMFEQSLDSTLKGGILNLTSLTANDYSLFLQRYLKIQRYFQKEFKQVKTRDFYSTKRGMHHQLRMHGNIKKVVKKNGNSNENGDECKDKNRKKYGRKTTKIDGKNGYKKYGKKSFAKKNKSNKKKNGKQKKIKQQRDWDLSTFKSGKKSKKLSNADMNEYYMGNDDELTIDGTDDEVYDDPMGEVNLDSSDGEIESDEDFSDLLLPGKSTADNGSTSNGNSGGIWNIFSRLIGNKIIDKKDIEPVLRAFEDQLTSKNVVNSIAHELCQNLELQLIGRQISSFTNVKTLVTDILIQSLERILSSSNSNTINILHGINQARNEKRTYSIVFIGVNGVGKSTTLAKMIYYLRTRNLKVSVAACDTFRAGAVEQLKTHCKSLKCRLYEQGYARDSSAVAYNAIKVANTKKDDVILIDTAGRMQNNEPLMKSLVSLISRNRPDLILFVGEALVGNDGIDQLMNFNAALKRLHVKRSEPRLIDGIILTKFDTVDDKVGAAVSMAYQSKKPIVFIGNGQQYEDLKRMNVRTLISQLLK